MQFEKLQKNIFSHPIFQNTKEDPDPKILSTQKNATKKLCTYQVKSKICRD